MVAEAYDLRDSLSKTQSSLHEVFGALPDKFRKRGSALQDGLQLGLSSKLESVERVAEFVGTQNASQKSIVEELKEDARIARSLKGEVDALIEDLDAAK